MPNSVSIPVGVVIARERIDHQWQDFIWRAVGLLPGAPEISQWRELRSSDDWTQYHAATLPLQLFRSDTQAYIDNLGNREPVIYVVIREEEQDSENPIEVHLVTASPYEAQDYMDSGDDIVDAIEMPDEIFEWVKIFVDEHHKETKFKKRKNVQVNMEEHKFGQEPIYETRKRIDRRDGSD